jgi:DNA-binding GntR family transcriptional regulator
VREAFGRLAAEGQLHFVDNIGYSVPALPAARDYVDWAVARVVVESSALLYMLGPLDARLLDEADAINERLNGRHRPRRHPGSPAQLAFHAS